MPRPPKNTKRPRGRPPTSVTPGKSALSRLGRALRHVREVNGVSLSEFARWSDYSSSHLSRVEHAKATPSRELVEAYERRFHTGGLLQAQYAMVLDAQARERQARRRVSPATGRKLPTARHTKPGDRSQFVADLTIPDGTVVSPGARLEKRWRIKNVGSVAWHGRSLERVGSPAGPLVINSPRRVPIPDTEPGDTVDIAIELVAPTLPATTIAYWQMIDNESHPCFPDRYADGIYAVLVVKPSGSSPLARSK